MTKYATNNPRGSTDPRDLFDNAQNFDIAVNSITAAIWKDRFGNDRKTYWGMEQQFSAQLLGQEQRFNLFIQNSGYQVIGDYVDGPLTITEYNQLIRYDGELWKLTSSTELPYTTAGNTDETWGATDAEHFVSVGDASLRQNLASDQDGLGDSLVAVKQPFTGAVHRAQHDKNAEFMTPGDFASFSDALSAAVGSAGWLHGSTQTFTLTVGNGGQFVTIADAINAACKLRPTYGVGNDYCEIRLLSGFVIDQQLAFDGGEDFSWIKITAEDAVVYADTSSFTQSARTYYVNKYLFYFKGQVSSPLFAVQLEENRDDSDVTAFLCAEGAKLNLAPYSGARKFYVGIDAYLGCDIIGLHNGSAPDPGAIATNLPAGYYLCDFSYSRFISARFIDGVRVSLPVSKFEYCQDPGQQSVLCIYGTVANFHGSSVSYSLGSGWNIRDNCTVSIRDHKSIRCGNIGIASIHGAFIDARCHHTEESAQATSGKVLEPLVEKGLFGCAIGVRCESAAIVEVAGNDIRSCGIGINTATGATVTGKGSDLSDCTLAFQAFASATQSFPRLWAMNVGKLIEQRYGSNFTTWTAHVSMNPASTQTRFIDTREGSRSNFYDVTMDANTGVMAQDGGDISISNSTLKINAIRSYFGSRFSLNTIIWDQGYKDATPQLNISRGSFLNAQAITTSDSAVLTAGVTKNTLSISGAIFAA